MTVAGAEWEVQPDKVLQESAKTNQVYSCTCSSPGKHPFQAVLKYGEAAPREVRFSLLSGRHTFVLAFTRSAFLLLTC